MELRFTARQLGHAVAAGILLFTVLHLIVQVLRFALGDHSLYGALTMFSLGSDRNFPTAFAALVILCCALLLAVNGRAARQAGEPGAASWHALALVFLFLACDEMLEIHERLIDPMRRVFDTGGLFHYAWVIPYGIATIVFAIVALPFLRRLPSLSRRLFVVAGAMFVTGAIGMEMLGGAHASVHGSGNVTYVAWQTIEELLEMSGMGLFLYALAAHLEARFGGVALRLGRSRGAP